MPGRRRAGGGSRAGRRFVSLELLKQRTEDSRLPDLPRMPLAALGGGADKGDVLQTNAGRPLRVPPRASGGGGGGGGGGGSSSSGGGAAGRPSPPRPQPAVAGGGGGAPSAAALATAMAASSGGWVPSSPGGSGGWALPAASGSSSTYRLNTANRGGSASSSGGGSWSGGYGGAYSGRGSGPVVASGSALALSWSDESPIWKDIPPPPLQRPAPSSTAASGPSSGGAASGSAPARPPARPSAAPAPSLAGPTVQLSAPPGQDLDFLSPAPIACRCSGVAGVSGRPPPDAAARPLFLPSSSALTYLDGTLPGDYGFDPLGLFDPSNGGGGLLSQRWLHTSEVVHGRWAMLGAAGCLAPEYLAHEKVIPKATGLLWFRTGFLPQTDAGYDYGVPLGALFAVQMVLMGAAEGLRWAEYSRPGSLAAARLLGLERLVGTTQPGSAAYPGGLMFNPLGLGADRPAEMRELQVAEVKHGRIAMLACLGYFAQAVVTGKGPYDNWVRHLEDPDEYNVLALLGSVLGQ